MKFEDSSLTTYLVNNLQPLTEADPLILAEYVAALLKKDKPIKELEKLCAEKLLEFLGQGTQSFITKLFQALEDGSFVAPARSSDAIEQVETSATRFREDPTETVLKRSALNTEEFSPSGCPSDQEEKEVTDDDDDDRNHKHRRRDNQSHSSDKDVQGQQLRRPNRKRNRPFENGHTFLANDPQPSENRKEYNPSFLEQRKRPGLAPSLRPYDMGLRTRTNQAFRCDPGSHFDISTSLGRIPTGRGRGRGSIPWSQSDSKFTSADTYDFSSQMSPQGPTLFAGRGMQSLGLIPGMPNGSLDALHPLGLQTSMNQPFNIAMPRQRCRDFEERGFCLRGDMCPMEHGVNRIVVEDVQSLSQFNLPVSLPSAHLLGTPAGSGALSSTSGPSSLMTNSKTLLAKSSKPGVTDDGPGLNRELTTSAAAGGADLYDPDQPLWNNDHPERSSALMGLSSAQVDDAEPLWNADPSGRHIFRLSDGVESEHPGRSIASTVGSQTTTSSVWERIGNPRNRVDMTAKIDSNASMGYNENETKEQDESLSTIPGATHQSKQIVSEDVGPKAVTFASVLRLRIEPARNSGRTTQKALRTLFVNCIPQKNNKKEALFSHFRKFGEVIDIYIPQNSERAFVQFSKREEAEAAFKAPDAVMGNRFIKLWWANRDSIPDNSISTGDTSSAAPSASASVPAQAINDSGRKENLPAVGLKITAASSSEVPVPTVHPKPVLMNSPRVIPPSQKKLENLELLKEELRLKQELLDQKRNDFRRQLDKLEKQAITVKGEETAAHTAKRQKPGMPKPMNPVTAGHWPGTEKTLDKTHSGENIESPSSKTNSTVVLQAPMNFKHQTRPSVQLGVPFVANRFKLDNRPSTFRILPLPADLANVGALREHFSAFGDLSAVELEDSEANAGTKSSEPQKSISARVTFTTRGSAEKAFLNGKNWQGHSLKFSWLTASNNSSSDHSGRESFPTLSLRSHPDAEVLAESATFRSSSDMGKSTCIDSEAPASTGNTESKNPEARMGDVEHVDVSITCQSSQTNSLSFEMPS